MVAAAKIRTDTSSLLLGAVMQAHNSIEEVADRKAKSLIQNKAVERERRREEKKKKMKHSITNKSTKGDKLSIK